MRRLLLAALVLFSTQLVGGFTFPTGSGSSVVGGGGSAVSLLYVDRLATAFTTTQCLALNENAGATTTCTSGLTRRMFPAGATLSRWEVSLQDVVSVNSGCTFTLATDTGDVATTTKPMLGDQAVAGRTLIATGGAGYSELVTRSVAAAGWVQVRVDDEAAGSAGNDGNCANAAGTDIWVWVYGSIP